jgi:alpha-1,3-rhamnosyl/mannosyltransferase
MLKVKDYPHRLVIVGRNSTGIDPDSLASMHGVADRVRYYSFVPDEDLAPLYCAAQAFVLPYSYEALSLTMLESQAAATPVITVGAPGLREMAGDAGMFVPDVEASTLANAMALIAEDSALREDLERRGLANAANYSWQRCSTETLEVCREAATATLNGG